MAITCPRCGAGYDVTLFQFGHRVRCGCGAWVELAHQQVLARTTPNVEGTAMAEKEIGRVSHYFSHLGVAAVEVTAGTLAVGDTIHVHGHSSDFVQKIDSIQLNGQAVQEAIVGQSIGIKVVDHAREHDVVYKLTD